MNEASDYTPPPPAVESAPESIQEVASAPVLESPSPVIETAAIPEPEAPSPPEMHAMPEPEAPPSPEMDAIPELETPSPPEIDAIPELETPSPPEMDAIPEPEASSPPEMDAIPEPEASPPPVQVEVPKPQASSESEASPPPVQVEAPEPQASSEPEVPPPPVQVGMPEAQVPEIPTAPEAPGDQRPEASLTSAAEPPALFESAAASAEPRDTVEPLPPVPESAAESSTPETDLAPIAETPVDFAIEPRSATESPSIAERPAPEFESPAAEIPEPNPALAPGSSSTSDGSPDLTPADGPDSVVIGRSAEWEKTRVQADSPEALAMRQSVRDGAEVTRLISHTEQVTDGAQFFTTMTPEEIRAKGPEAINEAFGVKNLPPEARPMTYPGIITARAADEARFITANSLSEYGSDKTLPTFELISEPGGMITTEYSDLAPPVTLADAAPVLRELKAESGGKVVKSESGVEFKYTHGSAKDFPPLPLSGEPVTFATSIEGDQPVGQGRLLSTGETNNFTVVNDGTGSLAGVERQDFEKYLPSATSMGLPGYDRTHPTGPINGPETPYGMGYSLEAINNFQKERIETDIRDFSEMVEPGVRVTKNVVSREAGADAVHSGFDYEVYANREGQTPQRVYASSIEVSGSGSNTRVEISPGSGWIDGHEKFLGPVLRKS